MNQLSRKNAKALNDLLDLGGQLRKAQRAAMSGRGAASLKELSAQRRKSVDALTKKAMGHLGTGGDAQREAIANSLEAAMAAEELSHALREGRLTKPFDAPSGFGEEIPGLSLVPDPPKDDSGSASASARERRRAARAQRRGADDVDGKSESDVDDKADEQAAARQAALERLADEKAAALEKAKEEAQSAAREAAAARAEVSRLQDALVTANGRAKAAAEKARVAQWAQSQAQQELDAATRRTIEGS